MSDSNNISSCLILLSVDDLDVALTQADLSFSSYTPVLLWLPAALWLVKVMEEGLTYSILVNGFIKVGNIHSLPFMRLRAQDMPTFLIKEAQ